MAWLFNIILFLMVFYSLNFTHISFIDLATIYSVVTTVEAVTAGFPVGAVEITMTSLFLYLVFQLLLPQPQLH